VAESRTSERGDNSVNVPANTERLSALLNNARGMNMLLDQEGRIQYTSRASEHLLGMSPESLMGRDCLEFVHEADRESRRQMIFKVRDEPDAEITGTFRVKNQDGTLRTAQCTMRNLLNDPDVHAIVCDCKDITLLVEEQEQFDSARSMYQDVLDSSEEAIGSFDGQHRMLTFNKALAAVLQGQYGIEFHEGMVLTEMLPPQDAEFFREIEDHVLQGETVVRERRFGHPSAPAFIEFSGYPIVRDEVVIAGSIYAKNISALRRAQRELQRMFEESPLAMYVMDIETLAFTRVNRAACELYGYNEKEFLELQVPDLRPESSQEHFRRTVQPKLRDLANEEQFVARHRKKDGTLFDVLIRNHLLQEGNRTLRIGLVEDITKRLTTERELLQANERYQLAMQAITSVVYELDLRTRKSQRSTGVSVMLGLKRIDRSIGGMTASIRMIFHDSAKRSIRRSKVR
jgi:PAS domain S-box-containing protein